MSQFIDEAVLHARAGDGGDGAVAWRREKYIPRGGPAGGDGGNGGNVVLVADAQKRSLLDFKYRPHLSAEHGEKGRSKNQYGHKGEDLIARVPVGTQVFDVETEELLADLTDDGQRAIICRGGSGGFGNTRFVTASRQAPDFAKPGTPGEERSVRLSLKLLADVGLLGFPNAGKSTFLSSVSAAKPKIADYPFTTLEPNLGVVSVGEETFILADIPGLIEGAADGAGLGVKFLKHLERVKVLCHLIEPPIDELAMSEEEGRVEGSRPLFRYRALRKELEQYSEELAWVPEVVVITKMDLFEAELDGQAPKEHPEIAPLIDELHRENRALFFMSSVAHDGLDPVKFALLKRIEAESPEAKEKKEKKPFDPLAKDKLR
jgi:GTP-binding protein